jgi:hypothetical protein
MMLTAKLYQEIISSLRTDPRPISDRRRYPRVGLRAKVNITPLDENRRPIGTMSVGCADFFRRRVRIDRPARPAQSRPTLLSSAWKGLSQSRCRFCAKS